MLLSGPTSPSGVTYYPTIISIIIPYLVIFLVIVFIFLVIAFCWFLLVVVVVVVVVVLFLCFAWLFFLFPACLFNGLFLLPLAGLRESAFLALLLELQHLQNQMDGRMGTRSQTSS